VHRVPDFPASSAKEHLATSRWLLVRANSGFAMSRECVANSLAALTRSKATLDKVNRSEVALELILVGGAFRARPVCP
jgi:hypothetical protein